MHISSTSNSLAALQSAAAAAKAAADTSRQGDLFSVDPTGGQDLQGAGATGLGSPLGGLIAPSSLLLAQQAADTEQSDPLASLVDPSSQASQSTTASPTNSPYRRPALS